MEGRKFQQLKQAMSTILSDLNPVDLFSIVIFSREVQVMPDQCRFVEAPLEYVTFIALQ